VHSERTPERLRNTDGTIHGLQIWVALPKALEQMNPSFTHIAEQELPKWQEGNTTFKLIAGSAFEQQSPVPIYSPMYLIEIKCAEKQTISIGTHLYGESGLYILAGKVNIEGNSYGAKKILVTKDAHLCAFEAEAGTTVYIF